MGNCVAQDTQLILDLQPEDELPINPSPWYGFKVIPEGNIEQFELTVELRYPPDHKHRYHPKISFDGETWNALAHDAVRVDEQGWAHFQLPVADLSFYVSAQENLNKEWYHHWLHHLEDQWPGNHPSTIGYSKAKQPIKVFQTNPLAPNFVLLLGRAHPPEVPGAFAMRAYIDELARIKVRSCSEGPSSNCRFFARNNFAIIPFLNPDGVINGHWRHNLGSTDLNRDWGPFTQPETRSVEKFLARLSKSSKIRLMLDFHSTHRNVLYTQLEEDVTEPPNFIPVWFQRVRELRGLTEDEGFAATFEYAPRPLSDLGTSKNYFFRKYGIPAITFETADNMSRDALPGLVAHFATSTVDLLRDGGESLGIDPDDESNCHYTYQREHSCDDFFCYLVESNKASIVSFAQDEFISADQAQRFSSALLVALENADNNIESRTSDYLRLEARLINLVGPDITNIHVGRSRQDLHGTVRRLLTRSRWLDVISSVQGTRLKLLDLANDHIDTVIPAYTHGVPSQPTTFAHQVIAYVDSFERSFDKLKEGFARVNKSPYGAAVGTTSSIPIDRRRIASYLGFDGPVENSYDANFISTVDFRHEFASVLSNIALIINQFVENIHTQQRDPWPWIFIGEANVSGSSSMPQKRNPRILDRLRTSANKVLASAYLLQINSHNVDAGMHDYRMASPILDLSDAANDMFKHLYDLLSSLHIDEQKAIMAVNRSFATSTQIADLLVSKGVSFRIAHACAAALVEFARNNEITLFELSEKQIHEIVDPMVDDAVSIELLEFRDVLDGRNMVFNRTGVGGPQRSEVQRMLAESRIDMQEDQDWFAHRRVSLALADARLQDQFYQYCASTP